MFLNPDPPKDKKKIFKCGYCKKPYKGDDPCTCYLRCDKCHCYYLKVNPCNSKKCLNENKTVHSS